ncbi:helix-turn-helix transcriptional regulator [Nocardia terpenica]|uniref:helix-turn-helix domain-containing protein n=1 Tax=Nocardia terpenica TaxID=455432 RepID=UPI001894E9E8|nr:helix-turn-helix domain-containing protein [Nocardia terpenica]MBF6065025.1 helix-turn-helix transcriptional regulator [Nocardia terpenica]MBF6108082.1 helix-turn-helix transcriptional regulator [Nocardia terpenica]MBF6115297.1 helix-turn-helix transcriptional regulator [Nocardia terpenica]MBF6122619.1 helix-turn-helix transcriptional regulator [Nocardia terpenica]
MAEEAGIGARTARARKLIGWTQARLASESGLSESLVTKVETGAVPASPAFVAAVARALKIEPEQLTGAAPYSGSDLPELPGVTEIRRIVAEWDYVEPLPAVPVARLEAEARALIRSHDEARTAETFDLLPGHIRRLYGALREPDAPVPHLYSLLCNAYFITDSSATRVGLTSLKAAVLGRMSALAEQADDPLYRAIAQIQRGKVLMYYNVIPSALQAVQRGLDSIEGDGHGATAVRGYGHLSAAIISARGLNYDTASAYVAEARGLNADRTEYSDRYLTRFGPTNLEIHSCAVELEAGDPGKAARDGSVLTFPDTMSPTRIGHHWQDVARAWLLAGEPSKSLAALNRARKIAPEQTRRHPSVRETVVGIAAAERRSTDSLGSFARWVGVAV